MAAATTAVVKGLVLQRPVTFVTGNAKKLEEVLAILGNSIPFQSLKLDCKYRHSGIIGFVLFLILGIILILFIFGEWFAVPELQGEPEDISKEKARIAAKAVHFSRPKSLFFFFFWGIFTTRV